MNVKLLDPETVPFVKIRLAGKNHKPALEGCWPYRAALSVGELVRAG